MSKYLDSTGLSYLWSKIKLKFVPQTRTINSKPLSNNITLTASDVGASATGHTHNYAGSSTVGGAAIKALQDGNGQNIATTYCTKAELTAAVQQLEKTISALNLGFSNNESDM